MAKNNKKNRKNKAKAKGRAKGAVLYFAFGSNLNHDQMLSRCPSAKFINQARLEGWELEFSGWSNGWGGSVANVVPAKDEYVPGVVWQMSHKDRDLLDRCEGHPWAYRRQTVWVTTTTGAMQVETYIMDFSYSCGSPSAAYVAIIAEGYDRYYLNEDCLWAAIRNVEPQTAAQWMHGMAGNTKRRIGLGPTGAATKLGGKGKGKRPQTVSRGLLTTTATTAGGWTDDDARDYRDWWGEKDNPTFPDDIVSDDPAVVQAYLNGFADDHMLGEIEAEIRQQNAAHVESRSLADVLSDPFGECEHPDELLALSADTKF